MAQSSSLLQPVVPMMWTSPRGAAQFGEHDADRGRGEIDEDVGAVEGRFRIVADVDIEAPGAGRCSPASRPMAGESGRSKAEWSTRPGVGGDGPDIGRAHPPAGAGDGDPKITHRHL